MEGESFEKNRGMDKGDRRLTHNRIAEIMEKFPEIEMDEGGEAFLISLKNGTKVSVPAWEKIPYKESNSKEGELDSVETRIRALLAEDKKDTAT